MGFSFFGLFGQTNKFKTVDVNEFEKFIADTSVVLLDVRTAAEYAEDSFLERTSISMSLRTHTRRSLLKPFRRISQWLFTAAVATEARMLHVS